MTDIQSTTKATREQASKRKYIDASNNEVDTPLDADGVSYTSKTEGWTEVFWIKDYDPSVINGLALFGAQTIMGNQTSRVRNYKGDGEAPAATEHEIVQRWLATMKNADWDMGAGVEAGIGMLAEGLVRVMTDGGRTSFKADGDRPEEPLSVEAAKARLLKKSKEERTKLRGDAKMKVAIAAITLEKRKAEAAAAGAPADATADF